MDTKKYIIDLPDNTAWLQWVKISDKDGHVYFDFKDPEDLTLYTEPDLDAIRNEAYKKYKLGYESGLNDAWDAARKIAKLNTDEQKRLFGCFGIYFVAHEFSAHEAIEKIRQYEQEQEERIQVGDEVNGKGGKGIITRISDDSDHFNVMWENGSTGCYMMEGFKKTGRHFPEIAEVLKKMQEETK